MVQATKKDNSASHPVILCAVFASPPVLTLEAALAKSKVGPESGAPRIRPRRGPASIQMPRCRAPPLQRRNTPRHQDDPAPWL